MLTMKTKYLALLLAVAAYAKPAPWYKWISKGDGQSVCAQTSPGPGWQMEDGPYWDARCTKRGKPQG